MLPGPAVLSSRQISPHQGWAATRLGLAPSNPALCPSLDPLFEASLVPGNKRKNKKKRDRGHRTWRP